MVSLPKNSGKQMPIRSGYSRKRYLGVMHGDAAKRLKTWSAEKFKSGV